MFGPVDNRITPEDRDRAYEILGFKHHGAPSSPPMLLDLSAILATTRLAELQARAREESLHRASHGPLQGLTEYRVGVELVDHASIFDLTEVRRGRPNSAGREVDRTRTIVGTIHTHPWDVSQSIGDVRNLIRGNDLLGGVVTHTGRMFLLLKPPDGPQARRSAFATELELQRASLREAPSALRTTGLTGVLSAALDLPVHATRDPYIRGLCRRLGLLYYAGDLERLALRRG